MSRLLYTSDLHIGHQRVSQIRGFSMTDDHDRWIEDVWNKHVQESDVVWVLGDVFIGRKEHAFELLKSLPGKKRLIAGNHDAVHPMHGKNSISKFAEWSEVFGFIGHSIRVGSNSVIGLANHFPYGPVDHTDEPRYMQWRMPDFGVPLLHGHTHSTVMMSESSKGTRMFNVGLDATGGFVEGEEVLKWIADGTTPKKLLT